MALPFVVTHTASNVPTVNVLGIEIHRIDYENTLRQVAIWIDEATAQESATGQPPPTRQICTVNPEFLVDAGRLPAFRAVLQEADLRVADGVGVAWAASILGAPVPQRITGSDGIFLLCEAAARQGWSVYFLGAAPGVADATATQIRNRYPGLRIAGTHSGSPEVADWPEIRARLQQSRPDILFVAFGHPRQDLWIAAHRAELHCRIAIGVGGAFDFATGRTLRAPVWMRRIGLEWLHRLITQPWRWRRMLKLPVFVARVLRQRMTA